MHQRIIFRLRMRSKRMYFKVSLVGLTSGQSSATTADIGAPPRRECHRQSGQQSHVMPLRQPKRRKLERGSTLSSSDSLLPRCRWSLYDVHVVNAGINVELDLCWKRRRPCRVTRAWLCQLRHESTVGLTGSPCQRPSAPGHWL